MPLSAWSQNWMMASAAYDSITTSMFRDIVDYLNYEYTSYYYDSGTQTYQLFYGEDKSDTAYKSMVTVNLHGGTATVEDDIDDSFDVELPDWSDCVFIWNGTENKISFSLSCDDSDFVANSLDRNNFNRFHCDSGDYLYIKINTLVDGKETGSVHYKLTKGKGYKVQYDGAAGKFEVYEDNRI